MPLDLKYQFMKSKRKGEHKMSVAETYNKNIPAYYDTMYLDGFKSHEIYASFKKQSREIANENEETNVNVVVEE